MNAMRRSAALPTALVLLGVGFPGEAGQWPVAGAAKEARPEKPRPRVTLSKQTTFVTKPLREDGYVDYVAALNHAASEGVTPENNAAVLLCRAFGPGEIQAETRERFFRMLGIDPLPKQGKYVVAFSAYTRRLVKQREAAGEQRDEDEYLDTLYNDFGQITERPWSEKEFPEMVRWLRLNEEPLRLIVAATRRPRFYTPMIAPPDKDQPGALIAVLLPMLQQTREAARLLKARAMRRLGEGNVAAAWQDLLACHRLGRLVGQDPTLVGALVGIAVDGMACTGDAHLIHHGKPRAGQARKMRADLKSLGPLPSMAEKINTGERYMYLDVVCALARGDTGLLDLLGRVDQGPSAIVTSALKTAAGVLIDWDVVLRSGNSWYDRMVEALSKPTHAQRAEAMRTLEEQVRAIADEAKDPKKLIGSFLSGESPRRVVSRRMANLLTALLVPAVMAARTAEDRAVTLARLDQIAFALAAYRADHGSYPKRLAALVPKYIAKLPADLFTGRPFRYELEDEGFLIYSLGPNMKDNGGKDRRLDRDKAAEGQDTSQWDDYRLRIPPQSD